MAEGNPLGSLAVGTEAQLRYAEDFTSAALDVRLLEVDEDLLQEILHTGVTIKGGDTQPAVLCTERKTFALVELPFTSNSLVLVPPVRPWLPDATSARCIFSRCDGCLLSDRRGGGWPGSDRHGGLSCHWPPGAVRGGAPPVRPARRPASTAVQRGV